MCTSRIMLFSRSFANGLNTLREKWDDSDSWQLSVLRSKFADTAAEQFELASDDDWLKKPYVAFLGEDGEDSGGPSREFFTLLFRTTSLWSYGTFNMFSTELVKKGYHTLGKAVAVGLVTGHPGPRCLDPSVVGMILSDTSDTSVPVDEKSVKSHLFLMATLNQVCWILTTQIHRSHKAVVVGPGVSNQ